MKTKIQSLLIFLLSASALLINGCKKEEDEMEPPTISFKTGGTYVASDASLTAGSALLIGIEAEKSDAAGESEDVLVHFNISKSLNGGTAATVYDYDLTTAEEELFDYDFNANVSTTVGDVEEYTFTITNRDGLTGQVRLTITAQ